MREFAWILLREEEFTETQDALFGELTKRAAKDPEAIGQGTLVSCFHT